MLWKGQTKTGQPKSNEVSPRRLDAAEIIGMIKERLEIKQQGQVSTTSAGKARANDPRGNDLSERESMHGRTCIQRQTRFESHTYIVVCPQGHVVGGGEPLLAINTTRGNTVVP